MFKLRIFIFTLLYFFSFEEFIEDIVEGTKSYTFEKETLYNFTFKAVKDGTYAIVFPGHFQILEATGEINEDVDIDSGFYSYIYAQNFVKGNYIKLIYPKLSTITERTTKKIRIEKIDGYFKLVTAANPIIFTMAFNDCQKPLYIFTFNNQPDYSGSFYTFNGKIHSGQFIGSYRTSPFDPDYSINKDFTNFEISSVTSLPYYLEYNMFKLQCKEPGIISIYIIKNNFISILEDINIALLGDLGSSLFSLSSYQFPINFYIQGFMLAGNSSIDFTDLGGKKYNTDYYDKIYIPINSKSNYKISFGLSNSISMLLAYGKAGEANDKMPEEKENVSVGSNKRLLIPLKIITDKKYIKIKSSVNKFYWDYLYSQTDDINYLPEISYRTMHFQKGNVIYIDNPYKYKKLKTDYYWFIYLKHYNDEFSIFNYEYTNEKEEDNKDNNKIYSKVWIIILIILLVIIIGAVSFYFIRKKRIESNSNIESLVKEI